MRTIAKIAGLIGVLVSASVEAQACSARGRYCSYPDWAANAFEDAQGRTPTAAVRPAVKAKKSTPR